MRTRLLKAGFFKNEELAELRPLERILYQGLWCLADRDGRLDDRPRRIKVEVLPYDVLDVDEALGRLSEAGFIHRYDVEGYKYISIPSFLDHQKPHIRETAGDRPAHNLGTPYHYLGCEEAPPRRPVSVSVSVSDSVSVCGDGGALSNLPECMANQQIQGRSLSSAFIDELGGILGPTWVMRPVNLGKIGSAIREGCPGTCDGQPAEGCATAFCDIAEKHVDKVGLIFHAIANDPRPWAEEGSVK